MVDLTVSIVNWNGKEVMANCLGSVLQRRVGIEIEAIVVDNASTDGSSNYIRKEFPQAHLIQNEKNRGYAFGNNQAFRASRGRYFLVLNSDVAVKGNALEEMVRYMDRHPEVGLLGGKLENSDGTFQPSANRHFPNLLDVFLEEIFFLSNLKYFFLKTAFGISFYTFFWNPEESKSVAWVGGACMLVRREVFDRVGAFDEHFFFYREDCDLCLRIRRGGWEVIYHPGFRFVHHWGYSSKKNSKLISIESRRSLLYYFQKHHGQLAFLTAKLFLMTGLFLRYFFLSLSSLFRKRDRERAVLFREMLSIFNQLKDPSIAHDV